MATVYLAQLQVTLGLKNATAQLVARPTDDVEAYKLYLRGREASHLRSPSQQKLAFGGIRGRDLR
jgi:hypothetical protein